MSPAHQGAVPRCTTTLRLVPSVKDVVKGPTELDDDDLAWLQLLVADRQIIADLSFADLVLWLPDLEGHGYWGGAQMRPTTAPTALVDDLVGSFVPEGTPRAPRLGLPGATHRPRG